MSAFGGVCLSGSKGSSLDLLGTSTRKGMYVTTFGNISAVRTTRGLHNEIICVSEGSTELPGSHCFVTSLVNYGMCSTSAGTLLNRVDSISRANTGSI